LKICIDTRWLLKKNSGVGIYISELTNGFANIDIPFDLYSIGEATNNEKIKNIYLSGFKKRFFQGLWKAFSFPKMEILTGPMDLVHFTNLTHIPNNAKKNILTIHDLSYEIIPHTIEPKNLAFLKKTAPLSIKKADHIITVSNSTKEDLMAIYKYPESKITVIHNGVSHDSKENVSLALKAKTQRKYDLRKDYLLSVSTLEPRKDYSTLIKAYYRLNKDIKNKYDLVICGGDGWQGERNKLSNLISKLSLKDNVKLLGFVDTNDLPALYSLASLYIHTSLYEGFGLPLTEAMSFSIPIISTKSSCHEEILKDAAIYFDTSNDEELAYKIELLLLDNARADKLKEASKNRIKNFSWQKTAEQTFEVYKNTMLGY